jgi:hypothetical protein
LCARPGRPALDLASSTLCSIRPSPSELPALPARAGRPARPPLPATARVRGAPSSATAQSLPAPPLPQPPHGQRELAVPDRTAPPLPRLPRRLDAALVPTSTWWRAEGPRRAWRGAAALLLLQLVMPGHPTPLLHGSARAGCPGPTRPVPRCSSTRGTPPSPTKPELVSLVHRRPTSRGRTEKDSRGTDTKWVEMIPSFFPDQTNPHLRGIFPSRDEPNPLVLKPNTLKTGSNPTQPTSTLQPNTCLVHFRKSLHKISRESLLSEKQSGRTATEFSRELAL